jgi:hypothetical protein
MANTSKAAVFAFVCLGAVAMMGLRGNANEEALLANEEALLARNSEMPTVDCDIGDPFFACFSPQWGFPAGDLFIWDQH